MEQGTPEWLEWRRQGLGGSEIAAIMGQSPYATPTDIWLEKTKRSTGFAGNYATKRGSELEDKARAKYELISLEDMPPALAVHPKYPVLRVSLDGIRADKKLILEIKCPGHEAHQEALAGRIPPHYMLQIQYQLAVTGAELAHYFSFGADGSHALIEVNPDLEMQGLIIAKALEFWSIHIEKDIPPKLTDDDIKLSDDPEIIKLCDQLINHSGEMEKADIDFHKLQILELGKHSKIRCGRVLVTSSKTKSGKISLRLTIGKSDKDVA